MDEHLNSGPPGEPAEPVRESSDGKWFEVPTGRFVMGTDDEDAPSDERPARLVTIGSLAIAGALLTTAEFARFVAETGYLTIAEREGTGFVGPSHDLTEGADWRHPRGPESTAADSDPVVQVAWFDALAYCDWATVRLPTEAEWAYAVHREPRLRTPQLWQWCSDWYDPRYYRTEQRVNPIGPPAGTERVVRGGDTRVTARRGHLPDLSVDDLGVRVVSSATAP